MPSHSVAFLALIISTVGICVAFCQVVVIDIAVSLLLRILAVRLAVVSHELATLACFYDTIALNCFRIIILDTQSESLGKTSHVSSGEQSRPCSEGQILRI